MFFKSQHTASSCWTRRQETSPDPERRQRNSRRQGHRCRPGDWRRRCDLSNTLLALGAKGAKVVDKRHDEKQWLRKSSIILCSGTCLVHRFTREPQNSHPTHRHGYCMSSHRGGTSVLRFTRVLSGQSRGFLHRKLRRAHAVSSHFKIVGSLR